MMTAKDIQRRLCADLFQTSFIMPSYTPSDWFECDVFELTGRGYFREYEIKVSRGDFKQDALKAKTWWRYHREGHKFVTESGKHPTKHQLLSERSPFGPVQFWFVVPRGMVTRDELPEWAGLIEAERETWRGQTPEEHARARVNLFHDGQRPAPRLHDQKLDSKVRVHANGTCYWRMHRLLAKGGDAGLEAGS